MQIENLTLYKRVTLIIEKNIISKAFYPVISPAKNSIDTIEWIKDNI